MSSSPILMATYFMLGANKPPTSINFFTVSIRVLRVQLRETFCITILEFSNIRVVFS